MRISTGRPAAWRLPSTLRRVLRAKLGQIAVAQVILNRVTSRKYPNTICGVVYQNAHMANRCQFSFRL